MNLKIEIARCNVIINKPSISSNSTTQYFHLIQIPYKYIFKQANNQIKSEPNYNEVLNWL